MEGKNREGRLQSTKLLTPPVWMPCHCEGNSVSAWQGRECPDSWSNLFPRVWKYFQKRLVFEPMVCMKVVSVWVGIINPLRADGTKQSAHPSAYVLWYGYCRFSSHPSPWLTISILFCNFQASALNWELTCLAVLATGLWPQTELFHWLLWLWSLPNACPGTFWSSLSHEIISIINLLLYYSPLNLKSTCSSGEVWWINQP